MMDFFYTRLGGTMVRVVFDCTTREVRQIATIRAERPLSGDELMALEVFRGMDRAGVARWLRAKIDDYCDWPKRPPVATPQGR